MRIVLTALFIIVLLVASTVASIDHAFYGIKADAIYSGCLKVWAHRGHHKTFEENSIDSFDAAFKLGAPGTELDVFYDLDRGDYIISHESSYKLHDNKVLLLRTLFEQDSISKYYWLDMKNLKAMEASNASEAAAFLYALLTEYNLIDRVIVESKNHDNLALFAELGINTSYWISPNENRKMLRFWFYIYRYKINYIFGEFSAVSMDFNRYTPKVREVFSHLPVHLFTVNNKNRVSELMRDDNVKIILSDENYYLMNSCAL